MYSSGRAAIHIIRNRNKVTIKNELAPVKSGASLIFPLYGMKGWIMTRIARGHELAGVVDGQFAGDAGDVGGHWSSSS